MAKKSIVVEIMKKRLAPYGFRYDGYDHLRWNFIREMEGVTQDIVIQKDPYGEAYTMEFSLSDIAGNDIPGSTCRFKSITDDPEYKNDFLDYETKEEQIMVLNKLGDFVDKYGINKLNELIQWEKTRIKPIKPTIEMSKKVYEEHTELTEQFVQRNHAEDLSEEEIMQLVKEKLVELRGENYENIKDKLVELAAVYGDAYIKKIGGYWKYNKVYNITSLFTFMSPGIQPLDDTIWAWQKGQEDDLLAHYHNICARTIEWIKEMRNKHGDNWQKEHGFYKKIGYEIPLY